MNKISKEDITSKKINLNIRYIRPSVDISKCKTVSEIFDKLTDDYGCGYYWFCRSYYKNGNLHCDEHKYRSIGDIIKMIKYYHPDMTIEDIVEELLRPRIKTHPDTGNTTTNYPVFGYCPDIRKIRVIYNSYSEGYLANRICGLYYRNHKLTDFIDYQLIIKHLLNKHCNTEEVNIGTIKQLLNTLKNGK